MSNVARANRAKGKNSFLLYDDFFEVLRDLTDEEAGQIFRKIYEHRLYLKDPEHYKEPDDFTERMMRMIFSPIRNNLTRDWEAYVEACQKKANNSSKGNSEETDSGDEDSG